MQVSVSVPLRVSISEAWDKLSDLEDHVNWMADAERIDFDGELRKGQGVVMQVLTRVGPFSTTDVIEVVEWEPPRLIRVEHTGLFTGQGAFHLAPMGENATLFTWEEEIFFPWYLGGPIGAGFAKPILTLVWKRNLARLKRSVEER